MRTKWPTPTDLDRFRDENGVVDLRALRRAAFDRQHGRLMGALAIACGAFAVIGGPWLAATGSVVIGVQATLLGLGMAWATGCMWAESTHAGTPLGRRGGTLMPLGVIPCVIVTFIPLLLRT